MRPICSVLKRVYFQPLQCMPHRSSLEKIFSPCQLECLLSGFSEPSFLAEGLLSVLKCLFFSLVKGEKKCEFLCQQWRSSWKLCFSILADLSHCSPSCSVTKSCLTLCDPMDCGTPGFPVLHIRWLECWSFSIRPSREYSGLISLRIDQFDLLAVQGTLESLLQHHSLKASILWRSAFFTVQLSHPYMTTGKTIALTTWTFVSKTMSLLFNILSRLVIAFLPRSKRLLISWLQSPSAVILQPQKIKSVSVSIVSPSM